MTANGGTGRKRNVKPRTHCRKGHAFALVGRTKNGMCPLCRREWHRNYMKTWNPERRKLATERYNAVMPELRTRLPRAEVDHLHELVGERGVARLLRTLLREFVRLKQRKSA